MIISVPEFGENPALSPQIRKQTEIGAESGAESGAELGAESGAKKILTLLQGAPLSKSEIASRLELNTVTGALNRTIKELLFKGMIEYTIPEKPQSRMQKYIITEKGKHYLDGKGD